MSQDHYTSQFDLHFRPESYWDFADPASAVVANIQGDLRRQMVRDALAA